MSEDKSKKRKLYIKKQMKLSPPKGSELVLYGSIIILIWALGELNASYTFILAWFKTDQSLIEKGYITFKEYFFEILLKTPEAVAAIKQLAVLALGAVMGLVGIIFRKRKISIPMIITALILATYEVADPFWMRLTDYTRYVKLGGCALILIGSILKIATWFMKRDKYGRKFDEKQKTKAIKSKSQKSISTRSDKTLIPKRIEQNSKSAKKDVKYR